MHAKFQPVASHGDPFRANLEILKGWVNSEGLIDSEVVDKFRKGRKILKAWANSAGVG